MSNILSMFFEIHVIQSIVLSETNSSCKNNRLMCPKFKLVKKQTKEIPFRTIPLRLRL